MPKFLRADVDNISLQQSKGTAILLDFRTGDYFEINETAKFIWKCLTKKATSGAEIASALSKKYKVTPNHALKDVSKLLRKWKNDGLILECH